MAERATIRVGTRGSQLALWQAAAVRDALLAAHRLAPDAVEIVTITTSGDRIKDRPLSEAGGKGLFTKEIEAALLADSVDIAVHSAKDMETFLPAELQIGAVLPREDVREALVAREARSLEELPTGARIGTASLRRVALLKRIRPDLTTALLRGNVPTRIRRIEDGDFDATLLAAAGMKRLGLEKHIAALLPLEAFPPACGQGVVAIECRRADTRVRKLLSAIDHRDSAAALVAERAFLAAVEGSCKTPVAGYARIEAGHLHFNGIVLSDDGAESYEATGDGDPADAEAIGEAAGADIRRRAPREFLSRFGIGAAAATARAMKT